MKFPFLARVSLFVAFLLSVGAVLPSSAFAAAVTDGETSLSRYHGPNEGVEEQARAYFADIPVMIEIARCESEFKHYNENGTVRKNHQGSSATGLMQIMSSIHRKPAARLGFDIDTPEGNMEYARHLYEKNGTWPWLASKHCWNAPKSSARWKAASKEVATRALAAFEDQQEEDDAATAVLPEEHQLVLADLKTQLLKALESMSQKTDEEPIAMAVE